MTINNGHTPTFELLYIGIPSVLKRVESWSTFFSIPCFWQRPLNFSPSFLQVMYVVAGSCVIKRTSYVLPYTICCGFQQF